MQQAGIEETATGRRGADHGWFILNLAEMDWQAVPGGMSWIQNVLRSLRRRPAGVLRRALIAGAARDVVQPLSG